MASKSFNLMPDVYNYLQQVSLREPAILRALRAETAQLTGAVMQVAPEQGQLLALLVQLMGAQKTLEVGVFTGYSSLVVALALPPNGRIVACDIDATTAAIAQRYWARAEVDHKIDLHIRPALETLEELLTNGQAGTFDFAFIDADKHGYDRYYELSLKLLRPGGLIAIDNVLWSGRVADPNANDSNTQAIRALNAKLHDDPRITLSLVPIADGLTLALKNRTSDS